jgi:hypothetical protein
MNKSDELPYLVQPLMPSACSYSISQYLTKHLI